ncbi:hypothetical protein [Williamsia serinedens]|uniref:Lipoprotein n=1 Tax=Williamsia serinedens TaxID=391736 RepID=A0ABT1H4Z2_9NOCA|nr:hypothetical protein [Williamsia serinedens]MCP2162298.1 hypothetical protein [Williamsia serinedens]
MGGTRAIRGAVAAAAAALLLGTAACGASTPAPPADSSPRVESASSAAAPTPPELPRGGRVLFPGQRLVALYGTDDGGGLGALGVGTPDQAAVRLEQQAAAYARPGRPVLPVMEMIVTVADPTPGPGGCYSHPIADADVDRYLAAARAHRQMLVLDVQPGQCPFLPQVQRWTRFLTQPDVGLALDAEWRMPSGVVPGTQIGTVSGGEVNGVVTWLADLTRRGALPQKPLVLHQFTPDMITGRGGVLTPPELALIAHTDGFGTTGTKVRKYAELADPRMHPGFKVFYRQDIGVMNPAQVLALAPSPDYISYQ